MLGLSLLDFTLSPTSSSPRRRANVQNCAQHCRCILSSRNVAFRYGKMQKKMTRGGGETKLIKHRTHQRIQNVNSDYRLSNSKTPPILPPILSFDQSSSSTRARLYFVSNIRHLTIQFQNLEIEAREHPVVPVLH